MKTNFRDYFYLAKPYMHPSRLWNALQVYFSYRLSRLFKKPIQWGKPVSLSIEPTTACNLKCPQCPSGLRQFSRPTGRMPQGSFMNTIDQVKNHAGYLILYFQGEPYINAQFTDMVGYATKSGLYTATSTNAHFLTPENAEKTVTSGLKRIIISIDGSTEDTYQHYRKEGSLAKVLEGTRNLVEARRKVGKKHPYIIWQFIIFKHNEHQLKDIKRLAKEYRVDKLAIKTAQIYDYTNTEEWMPLNEDYSRYSKKDDNVAIKNKMLNHCWRLWSSCVITWDGRVVPCCFDKDAEHNMGEMKEIGFPEIWDGPAYTQFRKKLVAGRRKIDICTNCTEGTKVWI